MPVFVSDGTDVGGAKSIQTLHDAAADGDTILIPDGNYTWNTGVSISKWVKLLAQNMPANSAAGIAAGTFHPSAVNITFGTIWPATAALFLGAHAAGSVEIGGLNWIPGAAGNTQSFIELDGTTNHPVLMHDCQFPVPDFQMLHPVGWFSGNGVVWYCRIFGSDGSRQGSGSGGLYNIGSVPWWQQDTFGTLDTDGTKNFYIEDCLIENLYNQALDFGDNARAVIRYNLLNNSQILTHGVTGNSGGRHIEVYRNKMQFYPVNSSLQKTTAGGQTPDNGGVWPPMGRWCWMRAGTARIHDNVVNQIYSFGYFGEACAWQFINESLSRTGPSQPTCQFDNAYIGWHWCGSGGKIPANDPHLNDGTYTDANYGPYKISDPIYVWANTYTFDPSVNGGSVLPAGSQWACNDQNGYGCQEPINSGNPATSNMTADVFLINRDIFLSAPPAGAGGMTGYTYAEFAYPHPLRTAGGGGGGDMAAFNPAMTINTLLNQLVVMDAKHTTELTTTTDVAYYENVMQINWPNGSRIEIRTETMSRTPDGVRLKPNLPSVGP